MRGRREYAASTQRPTAKQLPDGLHAAVRTPNPLVPACHVLSISTCSAADDDGVTPTATTRGPYVTPSHTANLASDQSRRWRE